MSTAEERSDIEARTRHFVLLLSSNERRLSAYVHALMPDWGEAEDVIQETRVRLWEQFGEYRPQCDFGAWACTVARYLVLAARKKSARSRLFFDDKLVELVTRELAQSHREAENRLSALANCVRKLDAASRAILRYCYGEGLSVKAVAERMGRSVEGTYMALSRIRRRLRECIDLTLTDEAM